MSRFLQLRPFSALLLAGCSFLSACQQAGPPAPVVQQTTPSLPIPSPQPPSSSPDATRQLIVYITELRRATPARLTAEASIQRGRLQSESSVDARTRLAACLALLPGEEAEAITHLEVATAQNKSPEIALIIDLLTSNVRERRRYRENVSNLQNRNREAGRQQEDLRLRQEALKRQIEELERKLAALKDIEKSLLQRP